MRTFYPDAIFESMLCTGPFHCERVKSKYILKKKKIFIMLENLICIVYAEAFEICKKKRKKLY